MKRPCRLLCLLNGIATLIFLSWLTPPAKAELRARMFVSKFGNGDIFEVDPATGASVPGTGVSARYKNGEEVGYYQLTGITTGSDGLFYSIGARVFSDNPPDSLFTIDPISGELGRRRPLGGGVIGNPTWEGDLDFDPTTGILYGIDDQLYTINPTTGLTNFLAGPNQTCSALAFDIDGTLYALNTAASQLMTLDKSTGSILTTVSLVPTLGVVFEGTGAMDFNPLTGELYVATALNSQGSNKLYKLIPATGQLTFIASIHPDNGYVSGLTFLMVPEPSTMVLGLLVGVLALTTQIRKR